MVISPLALAITGFASILKENDIHLKLLFGTAAGLGLWGVCIQVYKVLNQDPESGYIENFSYVFDEILGSICMEVENILRDRGELSRRHKDLLTSLRLTLFIKDPIENKYIADKVKEDWKLIIIGRYASYETRKDTKVSFCINKGACGKAFKLGKVVSESMGSFTKDPDMYYRKSRELFNMSYEEVDNLSKKSGFYLAIPIKEPSNGKIVGSLVVDTDENTYVIPENIQIVFEDLLSSQVQRGFYRKTLASLINKINEQVSNL